MPAPHAQQIIDGYMARLEAAMGTVSSPARTDLIADVRSHISEARAALPDETDADVLNILDRLGEPAVLAADATGADMSARQSAEPVAARSGRLNGTGLTAILLLTVGAVFPGSMIPFVGPLVMLIVGLIVARSSGEWSDLDVSVAGLLPVLLACLLVLATGLSRGSDHLFILLFVGGPALVVVPSGIFLALRARARRSAVT